MVEVHEQPVSAEARDDPEAIKVHEQPKASQQGNMHGEVGSRDHTAVADKTVGHGMGIGKGIVLGLAIAVALRKGMRWWSGRASATGYKTFVRAGFNKVRSITAKLW